LTSGASPRRQNREIESELSAAGKNPVTIADSAINIVHVKSINPVTPLW